jgi:hypothetical protein
MSNAQYCATLTINGQTLFFSSCITDGGWPEDEPELVQEELAAKGVDYVDYRDVGLRYPPWTMRTMENFSSWDSAVDERRRYRVAVSAYGTLMKIVRGRSTTFPPLKVRRVAPDLVPGTAVGFGAVVNSSAILTCTWEMVFV